ncbi:hypothetical protein [Tolypothrix sp. VBCCA 56010]
MNYQLRITLTLPQVILRKGKLKIIVTAYPHVVPMPNLKILQ